MWEQHGDGMKEPVVLFHTQRSDTPSFLLLMQSFGSGLRVSLDLLLHVCGDFLSQ